MSRRSRTLVLQAACELVSALPPDLAAASLEELCSPLLAQMNRVGMATCGEEVVEVLETLQGVVGHVQASPDAPPGTAHPVAVLLSHSEEALRPLLTCDHASIQAAACKVLCAATSNARCALGPTLLQLIELISAALPLAPGGSHRAALLQALQSCSEAAVPRPSEPHGLAIEHSAPMSKALAAACAAVLPAALRDGTDAEPDLTESLFLLAVHAGGATPQALAQVLAPVGGVMITRGLQTQHREAGRAVLRFVMALATWCSEAGALGAQSRAMCEERGGSMVGALLVAINGGMPSWALDTLVEALGTLLSGLGLHVFRQLLIAALEAPDVPRLGVKEEAKQAFIQEVLGEKANGDRRIFKRIIKAFCGGKKKSTRGMPNK